MTWGTFPTAPRQPLSGSELALLCETPVENPETGRPVVGTGDYPSADGPTAGLNASQRRALAAATSRSLTLVQGPPGTGKTYIAKRLAYVSMKEKDDERLEVVQFHQSYSYEDFIQGFRPKENI